MVVNEDKGLRELIEQEKKQIPADTGDFIKFLAYTHDDGPDDVEPVYEPERTGIRKLKGTPVWTILYPARKGYHIARYLYQTGFTGFYKKAENAIENSRYARKKRGRQYLTKIMPTEEEKQKQRERVFEKEIKISVLVPLFNTPEPFLRDMIESVTAQTYQNFELCLCDASDDMHTNVGEIVAEYVKKDGRIVYKKLEKNEGIAENTNACIRMATGNYLALFDHDDILHPSALYECAKVIEQEDAEFVYTDEATFEGEDIEDIMTYHFKPDFSVDNLRGVNYICHLSVFKKELTDQVGLFREEYDGSQDHDIIMRLTDAAKKVCHVPKILYFWRCHKMSTSMNLDSKSYAIAAGRRAVRDAEARRGYPAEVHSAQICKTHYRMKYQIGHPKISVVIDGKGKSRNQIARTAAAIEARTTYDNYELLYATSFSELSEVMQKADGEYLLLLSVGMMPITPTFMEELLMFAQRKDVGLVGMQVLDEKDLILSSDIVIGNTQSNLAIEVNRMERYDAPGYMGRNYYAHNISAVSGCGCMGRKEEFAAFFAEGITRSTFGRILEVCFKQRNKGRWIVLNPYALGRLKREEYNEELSAADREHLMKEYKEQILSGDPFYNGNLSLERYWQKK